MATANLKTSPPKTLIDAIRYFSDPENCRDYLVSRRWPNGVSCPVCGSEKVYVDKARNGWELTHRGQRPAPPLAGGIGGRMQRDFHHGLVGFPATPGTCRSGVHSSTLSDQAFLVLAS